MLNLFSDTKNPFEFIFQKKSSWIYFPKKILLDLFSKKNPLGFISQKKYCLSDLFPRKNIAFRIYFPEKAVWTFIPKKSFWIYFPKKCCFLSAGGHMLPYDEPRSAFDMMWRFIFDKGFGPTDKIRHAKFARPV